MNKYCFRTVIFLLFVVSFATVQAQPFVNEIAAFKRQDSISVPPKNAILFVGSSSFTKWTDVQDYFPNHKIINRGFGGSSLLDVICYANIIIFPYQPKQIIIYCGENDFAENNNLYPSQVLERFKQLFSLIRHRYEKVPIAYISMKPSPNRRNLMPKFNVANVMIKEFLKNEKRTIFIDVYHAMLKEDGTPAEDLFIEDKLHMNEKGYVVWQKLIKPVLKK